jgi:hypothetical protein
VRVREMITTIEVVRSKTEFFGPESGRLVTQGIFESNPLNESPFSFCVWLGGEQPSFGQYTGIPGREEFYRPLQKGIVSLRWLGTEGKHREGSRKIIVVPAH